MPKKKEELVELPDLGVVLEVEEGAKLSAPIDTETPDLLTILDAEESAKKKKETSVQAEDANALVSAFGNFAEQKKDPWYKKKENQPTIEENGSITMHFKSPEDLAEFSLEQADKKQNFIMIDKETNKVLAYSNGKDGQLYNGDHTPYDPKQKGAFKVSTEDYTPAFEMKGKPASTQKDTEVDEEDVRFQNS